jgi:hypothetical protein
VRFLRLAPFIALTYYVLFAVVHPMLLEDAFHALTRDVIVERSAFLVRVAFYAIFGLMLVVVNIVFDYAKVRAVVEDRRSMVGAIVAGGRFARRNVVLVASLYMLTAGLFLALLMLYGLVDPGARTSGAGLWLGFAVSQLYLLGRIWIRLVFLASETSLFQSRLAHTGYIASATIPRPEPPILDGLK